MTNPTLSYIEVDTDALAHNARAIREHVGPTKTIYAVVKANAYGHGAVETSRILTENGVDRLGVSRAIEGFELREGGITAPILVMGYALPDETAAIVAHDLIAALGDDWDVAKALSDQAVAQGKTISVQFKIDTGMSRFGLLPDEAAAFMQRVATLPNLVLEGAFTHLATSDNEDKSPSVEQFKLFTGVIEQAKAAGITLKQCHCANSAATLAMPDLHLEAVRPGIVMYGLYPSQHVPTDVPLKPALSIKSHVARVKTLPAGTSIGYDRTFITPQEMRVALIPVGYGDGYPRLLTGKTEVLIHGKRVPNVGRVCMDMFAVDVSGLDDVQLRDEVVLLGAQGNDRISAEEMAGRMGTINYEVVTKLLPRLTRVYV